MKNLILSIFAIGLLASCQNAPKAEKVAASAAQKVTEVAAAADTKMYMVSPGSNLEWVGAKIAGKHNGTINVAKGKVDVAGGKVVGGLFKIDMNSLVCTDLAAGKGKEDLEGHLKSADFFNVAEFPTCIFEITAINGNEVTGNLNMLGVTKSISFPANMSVTDAGVTITSPEFTINRTDWGLKYGSASFFDNLKDKAIDDNITLKLNVKAS